MTQVTRYLTHIAVLVLAIGLNAASLGNALQRPEGFLLVGHAASGHIGISERTVMVKPLVPARTGTGRDHTLTYEVQSGDTLWTIAAHFGLSLGTLKWSNGMEDIDTLSLGQKLQVPPADGILLTVANGGSRVSDLATRFHSSVQDIVVANNLRSDTVAGGSQVFLPGAYRDEAVLRGPVPSAVTSATAAVPSGPTGNFGWPADGYVTQYFSAYHNGLDIGAPYGTPEYASDGGTVIHAGWGWYGIYVEIDHGNGFHTIYGHLESVGVHTGQWVGKGHYLGAMGCTGHCTGPHVHFMIVYQGVPQNPLAYL